MSIANDIAAIPGIIDALEHKRSIDDRKLLLEHAIVFMSHLPPSNPIRQKGQGSVINMLYNDLPHPPASFVGDKYKFRAPGGGGNNIEEPDLGRAGTPYSRSVPQTHPLPLNELPDPGLLFDCLLKRDKFEPHPAGFSSLFFSFATIVIHTIFRTNPNDPSINDTSSYLDLSPLYGNSEKDQDEIRRKDGTGRLWDDVFTEERLLLMPPAVCALLVLFNRNHNFIAHKLYLINEAGKFRDPDTLTDSERHAQDHILFNTARLVNVGCFISVVLGDYMRSGLGLIKEASDFALEPFMDVPQSNNTHLARGQGNSVSVEISPQEFGGKVYSYLNQEKDKKQWKFGGIERHDSRFRDEDLARIIKDATAEAASAFKARGTPSILRVVEILGIVSSRNSGVCSLNEFQKFLGLKPYESFTEWNPDHEIATAAKRLYKHPDNLELYVGLQAEQSKPATGGSNLCCGFTIGRAILSDAICLTRGDRYLTTDWTTNNLTSWGFNDASRDYSNPSFGGMIGKRMFSLYPDIIIKILIAIQVISRTLPGQFSDDSSYLWFPFYTPETIKKSFTPLGIAGNYSYSRPVALPSPSQIRHRPDVLEAASNTDIHRPYEKKIQTMVGKRPGFFLALNREEDFTYKGIIHESLILPNATKLQDFFYNKTKVALEEHSYTLASHEQKCLDIVEAFSTVITHFVSEEIGGLSLKTHDNPEGKHTEHELKHMLEDMYTHVFVGLEAQYVFGTAKEAKASAEALLKEIKESYQVANGLGNIFERITEFFHKHNKAVFPFMRRLYKTGKPTDQLLNAVLAAIVASFEYIPALVNVVYFYLSPDNGEHRDQLIQLSNSQDPQADEHIAGYIREGLRLSPLLNTAHANLDHKAFPKPKHVDPSRPATEYQLMGDGLFKCFADEFIQSTMVSVIRAVFQLKNVGLGPGNSGALQRFKDADDSTSEYRFLNSKSVITPFPTSLTLQYDA
ncbi:heme peroxidase [Ceratobasidium sp. AG-Ba]|nr:heme peroxidase [Ceratobasidium sp. AG-Ba]